MPLSPGTRLNNRYRIVSILGQGGMGAVYRAEDEHLGVPVAVKENMFLSQEYTRQFRHEANILASLRHPNLPRVGDYFAVEGQGQYLIMDYIDGEDLRQRIERTSTLEEREVILIGAFICDALSYMHSRTPPVVHRDIKPGNIKITPEGEVVLVDFGLAKRMMGGQATTTGARAMTPGYSPPEQYGTARTDSRTDIYSLGATLYAALTGIIPEDGLARATGKASLTPIRQLRPKVDRRLASAIEKALEIEPENRYQKADDFRQAILDAGNMGQITIPRYLITPPPGNFTRSSESEDEQEEVLANGEAPKFKMRSAPIPSRMPRKRRRGLIPAFLTASLLISLAGVFFIRPDMTKTVLARFFPSPSTTATLTAAATQTGETITIAEVTGQTPELPTDTPTPTVEPTIAETEVPTATIKTAPLPTYTPEAVQDQIAFASDRSGNMQIWLMNKDGSEQRQISNIQVGACQPSWSPDGMRLAFISPCIGKENQYYENARIYTMDVNGNDVTLLPPSATGDFDPAWSPDGKRIAFTSIRTGKPHIFVYNFDDSTLQELSDTRYPDIQPDWNPSGKQLVFVRESPFPHIWVMSDQGITQFQFSSSGNVLDLWPSWSPDGELIVFSRSQLDPVIPWLIGKRYEDRDNGKELRLPSVGALPDAGPVSSASISPDNLWITFESWPDGRNHDIFLMDIDGENRARLTTDPGFDFDPVWRPRPQ